MKNFATLALGLLVFSFAAGAVEDGPSMSDTLSVASEKKASKSKKEPKYNEKGQIIKTGYNLGPLPAVAFDADKGFQLGAILNVFNYGDGSDYPNYFSKLYFEASWFTKGSMLFQVMYDNKKLIPGVRWSSAAVVTVDKAFDFYGFNGYQSYFDYDRIATGKANKKLDVPDMNKYIYTPYYRSNRLTAFLKTDFVGNITEHFKWEAGYNFRYFRQNEIDRSSINKNKVWSNSYPSGSGTFVGTKQDKAGNAVPEADTRVAMPTLYELYVAWGLIRPEETMDESIGGHKNGFFNSALRLGLMYDTRDKEGAPTKGIWAEGHVTAAPKWLGTTNPYYRYSFTFRHYVPIVKNDVLTFAYRLNYEGSITKDCPYYVAPYITVMGENDDKDGFGGYRTVRGILRDRVMGLDMASYNAEFRYRFVSFKWLNQNMAFALSLFSDGAMVTRERDMSFNSPYETGTVEYEAARLSYDAYMKGLSARFDDQGNPVSEYTRLNDDGSIMTVKEIPHITAGLGLRFIMNENFIVAFEYGKPISCFYKKTSPYYMQDGTGAFYINVGYLF